MDQFSITERKNNYMVSRNISYVVLILNIFISVSFAQQKIIFEQLSVPDGLSELKNPNGDSFDYPRVEKIFREVADEPAQAIIDRLIDAGEMWRKDMQPDDDVTLMVIKA